MARNKFATADSMIIKAGFQLDRETENYSERQLRPTTRRVAQQVPQELGRNGHEAEQPTQGTVHTRSEAEQPIQVAEPSVLGEAPSKYHDSKPTQKSAPKSRTKAKGVRTGKGRKKPVGRTQTQELSGTDVDRLQERPVRLLDETVYPDVFEPDVTLYFRDNAIVEKTLWFSDELQMRAYHKLQQILSKNDSVPGDLQVDFSRREIADLRRCIREHSPFPNNIRDARQHMLRWLRAWCRVYREVRDERSLQGVYILLGWFVDIELEDLDEVIDPSTSSTTGTTDESLHIVASDKACNPEPDNDVRSAMTEHDPVFERVDHLMSELAKNSSAKRRKVEGSSTVQESKIVQEDLQPQSLQTSNANGSSDGASFAIKYNVEISPHDQEANSGLSTREENQALSVPSSSQTRSPSENSVGRSAAAKDDRLEKPVLTPSRAQSPLECLAEITFVDASNEASKYLPWMISFQLLKDIIRLSYENIVAPREPILDDQYSLLVNDQVLGEANWDALVEPGSTIIMRLRTRLEYRKLLLSDPAFQIQGTKLIENQVSNEGSVKRALSPEITAQPGSKKLRLAQLPLATEVIGHTEDDHTDKVLQRPHQHDRATASGVDRETKHPKVDRIPKGRKRLPSADETLLLPSAGQRRPAEQYRGFVESGAARIWITED